jgi:cytoskeletal protein CcmA (bactofilin family)
MIVGNTSAGGTSNLTVTGSMLIAGNLIYTNTSVSGDLRADVDGLDIGNTTNRFDMFIREGYVYSLLNPSSNTITLGNSSQRWVMSGNTLDLSGSLNMSGNLTVNTSSFKLSTNTNQVAINTATYSGALNVNGGANVTGDITGTANVTGVLFKNGNMHIATNTSTINVNTAVVVDQFANSNVKVVKYIAHAQNEVTGGKYAVEVLGLNVNSSILVSQYGEVNNVVLGTFNLIKTGANLQLTYTDLLANATNTSTVTVLRTLLN